VLLGDIDEVDLRPVFAAEPMDVAAFSIEAIYVLLVGAI
jgi:hypothetical protein